MAFKIGDIVVTADNVVNAIKYNYPNTFAQVENENSPLYEYLFLFGIRTSTCDTAIPDDLLGGLRYMPNALSTGGYWEMILTDGTTDPSPKYVQPGVFFDNEARKKGGTAWVKEGQYYYQRYGNYHGSPAFNPVLWKDAGGNTRGIPVYRWNPKFAGDKFDPKKAIISESNSCYIHRHWSSERYWGDSAGCQVFNNNALLEDLDKWAIAHNKHKTYPKRYLYTLLTSTQFLDAQYSKSSFLTPFANAGEAIYDFIFKP